MANTLLKVSDLNPADATPMMKQYLAIKQAHREYLLFYRMGDFYELFFEDAVTAAKTLDIALTKRGQHLGEDIPMCGVPFHSSEQYLQRLIRGGHKVAICEQTEDPEEAKKRGAKSVVRREVIRIITPGTITEDSLLESERANYLTSIAKVQGDIAIAWADISTGVFEVTTLKSESAIISELSRISPKEVLLADKWLDNKQFMTSTSDWKETLTPHVDSFFDSARAERKLKSFFKLNNLDALDFKNRAEISACGSLVEYLELTQKEKQPKLQYPKHFANSQHMQIDSSTRRNLELGRTSSGEYQGSLLSVIDRTVSSAGARLIQQHLSAPLLDVVAINTRLDMVEYFVRNHEVRRSVRSHLSIIPDIERALSRLCVGRGGPRDILVIRNGLLGILNILEIFESCDKSKIPDPIKSLLKQMDPQDNLMVLLSEALRDEVPMLVREGGFIRDGFDPKLDEFRNAHTRGAELKLELRDKYRQQTGVDKLKVGDNNLIGLYIEVSTQHINKMPENFVHRQTLANAVRYSTPELKELEARIINAEHSAIVLEIEIFDRLLSGILAVYDNILLSAHSLASLDVASANAEIAESRKYCRPVIKKNNELKIVAGRHPVVETYLKNDFVSNSCELKDKQNIWLMTGPNMAGKSTFLRQNALIIIMAQMGAYVPADSAEIGLVDRIFSRVGASDDLARGQSTFMVEMIETATILNQATENSFVILDEIGRGTATYDGLSIAWAVVEYLHNVNNCRALFATHYHEMTTLTNKLRNLVCYTMRVKEWNEDIIFLHEVMPGNADRSYGIHVAKLAGLPHAVTDRAEEVLKIIQDDDGKNAINRLTQDLPLFTVGIEEKNQAVEKSEVEEILAGTAIDNLTPRQAMELLYTLKEKIRHGS